MRPSNSTLVGEVPANSGGLRQFARSIGIGPDRRVPPPGLTTLLLPMVRRVIQTGRGPTTLVHWIRKNLDAQPSGIPGEQLPLTLTENLIRTLLGPADPEAVTLNGC